LSDKKTKKELIAQYKGREIIGGVYVIRNTLNNNLLLRAAKDWQGSKNRFEFSLKTGSCVDMKLQNDWNKQGGEQFVFEVLEEFKKTETQTEKENKADVEVLREKKKKKMSDRDLY
jgi:hypothetical protein